ncbi:MAG: AAA family ATPase [Bacteroidetes bacterium]|nr:AAA family ATPase [Bacteroidota bacterium]
MQIVCIRCRVICIVNIESTLQNNENAITILDHLHFASPTTEQKNALQGMAEFSKMENTDDFMILCGAAGTGKTSIVSAFIGYLNQQDIAYQIAAPTGRAARILGRKSKTVSNTIHSMIYTAKTNKKTGVVNWVLKQNLSSKETIYIIDEASMVPSIADNNELSLFRNETSLLDGIVAFVKNGHKNNKVLFLGDRYQLPPVHEEESRALCGEYLNATYGWKGKTNLLTEVKRQEDGSQIMTNAIRTRKGIDEGKAAVKLDGHRFSSFANVADDYVHGFLNKGSEHAISIGATHRMNEVFNKVVREKLFGKRALLLEPGDLMMVTTNWSRNSHHLFNGDHVTVKEFFPKLIEEVVGLHFMPVKILFKNLEGNEEEIEDYLLVESITAKNGQLDEAVENRLRNERFIKNPQFSECGFASDDRYVGALRLNYGYSITCHKAQGGEWEKVYFNTFSIPSLRFQYTAVTRAKSVLQFY